MAVRALNERLRMTITETSDIYTSVREAWLARVDAEFDEWIAPYYEALGAVLPDGSPDHATRIAASEAVLDRVYGEPTQRVEVTRSGASRGVHAAALGGSRLTSTSTA